MSVPRKAGLCVLAAVTLAACAPLPPELRFPEISFADRAPFRFDAAAVEVVEAYRPPLESPHVEHEAPVAPGTALRRWVDQRVAAAGSRGRVRVTIEDASIVETPLATNRDLEASLTTERAARFEGSVALRIALIDEGGSELAMLRAKSARTRSLPEDATLRERDQLLFTLTQDLANDIDSIMSERIPAHFAEHLVP